MDQTQVHKIGRKPLYFLSPLHGPGLLFLIWQRRICLVLFPFFSLPHPLLVWVINYLNIIGIMHPLHLVPHWGGGGSIKILMLWTCVWVPCVWEAWALTWNTKELVPKKTLLSMLELRQHMCKMYVSQEKAVTEQGVNPDQGSNGQDVCHGEQVNKQHPSWFLLRFLPWVPLSASLSGLWRGICRPISHFLSQVVSDLYHSNRNLIRADRKCRRKPEGQPSVSWVSLWKGIILGIESKTSCTPGKHSITGLKPQP